MTSVAAAIALFQFFVFPAAAIVGDAPTADRVIAQHLVMVIDGHGSLCTGTALSRDIVLTAAHCVSTDSSYQVVPYRLATPIVIRAIKLHPQFDRQAYARHRATADVALLKLAKPLRGTNVPTALGPARKTVYVGERFVVAGFGVIRAGSDAGLGIPRTATLTVTGRPGTLQVRLQDPQTRNIRAGLGACTGDSGAPMLENAGDRLAVLGVVSWSTGPNLSEGCGGLTGITPLVRYREWIITTVRALGQGIK